MMAEIEVSILSLNLNLVFDLARDQKQMFLPKESKYGKLSAKGLPAIYHNHHQRDGDANESFFLEIVLACLISVVESEIFAADQIFEIRNWPKNADLDTYGVKKLEFLCQCLNEQTINWEVIPEYVDQYGSLDVEPAYVSCTERFLRFNAWL